MTNADRTFGLASAPTVVQSMLFACGFGLI